MNILNLTLLAPPFELTPATSGVGGGGGYAPSTSASSGSHRMGTGKQVKVRCKFVLPTISLEIALRISPLDPALKPKPKPIPRPIRIPDPPLEPIPIPVFRRSARAERLSQIQYLDDILVGLADDPFPDAEGDVFDKIGMIEEYVYRG